MLHLAAADASVDAVVTAMESDGACVVDGLLTPDRTAQIKAELTAVLRSTPEGRNDFEGYATQRIYALFAKTRAFDALATHPLLLGVLDRVLGHYQLSAPVGISIGPGEAAQVLHRDQSIYPLPLDFPPVVVNTMWAFDDFTEANGATRVIPGSHRWGHAPEPGTPTEPALMSAGSVLFYPGTLWHGGGANTTDRPRLGVILEYAAGWLRAQENHVVAVPPSTVATLPSRLQELLGYNIYPLPLDFPPVVVNTMWAL
ncbi:MAG TPA: phytanoyl-CoA dioxygenase family protein, partial [Mycobacteriales bacterium]